MADRRYYTEGSSARQLNYDDRAGRNRSREAVVRGSAAPARRPQPSVRPERAPQPARRKKQGSSHLTDRERRELAARKAQRKAVTNAQIRYTAGMVAAIIVAVALCCYLLKLTINLMVKTSISILYIVYLSSVWSDAFLFCMRSDRSIVYQTNASVQVNMVAIKCYK